MHANIKRKLMCAEFVKAPPPHVSASLLSGFGDTMGYCDCKKMAFLLLIKLLPIPILFTPSDIIGLLNLQDLP